MFPASELGKDSVVLFTYISVRLFKFVNILSGSFVIALSFKYLQE